MTVLKRIISYILTIACLLSFNPVYADTSFTETASEIDERGEVYTFTDDFSRSEDLVDVSKTGTSNILDSNWSSKNSGTMDGDNTGVTTFGFDGQNLAVGYFKQDTYPKVSASQSLKMAGFNWTAPHSELSDKFVIKTTARKTHNVNMWGVRFMQHNDEQNYYMLFLGGQYSYQLTSGVISWGLYKVKNGAVSILKEQLQTEDPSKKFIGTLDDAELTITYNNGKISFNVAYNGDENYYSESYVDEDPYILTGDDVGIQLVASSCGSSAYPIYFRDFSIANYTPYITGGEPENVIYNDVSRYAKFSDNNVVDLFNAYPVRKIITVENSGLVKDIFLSEDGIVWDKITSAEFDSCGVWINDRSQKKYRYLYYDELDKNDLKVYTDVSENYIYDAVVTDTIDLTALSGSINAPSDYSWSVSNDTMAKIEAPGIITFLRRKGEVLVTAVKDDITFTAVFNVIGELEMANRSDTVDVYISEKKPVIDAVNSALSTGNFDEFKSIMRDEGEIKIGSIVDLDTAKVSALDDEKLLTLFNRLSTYNEFKCEIPQDLYDFSFALDREYAVGELCVISSASDFEHLFDINNEYIGIVTDEFYYKNYKTDVFTKLLNKQFTNYDTFIKEYNESLISVSYEKALSYVMIKNFVEFFSDVIGYNKVNYEKEKCDDLYKSILDKKGTLNTIAELQQYIDVYKKPEETTKPVTKPSGGGGGGGGGGSSSGSHKVTVKVSDEEVVTPPPLEIKPVTIVAFNDVDSSHWAYNSIASLKSLNVINGYSDGCFYPDNNVTRAEFVKILAVAMKLEIKEKNSTFEDVSENDWFAPYVAAAQKAGIVKGDGTHFSGNSNISRQEMAVMIYRSLENANDEKITDAFFSDMEMISEWAIDAVKYLKEKSIITGYDNIFNPLDNATRAEVAQIVSKVILED